MYLHCGLGWGCSNEQKKVRGLCFHEAYIAVKEAEENKTNRKIKWSCLMISTTKENSDSGK